MTFGNKRLKPIKLRQHVAKTAIYLSEVNGLDYKYNRMCIIDMYCEKGLEGIKLHLIRELTTARFPVPKREDLSLFQKLKLWIYGTLRR